MNHELKTLPEYFDAVKRGEKTFCDNEKGVSAIDRDSTSFDPVRDYMDPPIRWARYNELLMKERELDDIKSRDAQTDKRKGE